MADRIFFLFLATLFFEVNSQLCGCGGLGPVLPGPVLSPLATEYPCMGPIHTPPIIADPYLGPPIIQQPLIAAPPPIYAPPLIAPYPNVVASTIVDNSVSNALANALQLLIVSNLIENTLNYGVLPENIGRICETMIAPGLYEGYVTEVIPNVVSNCYRETPVIETIGPICGCENVPIYPNYVVPELAIQPMCGPAVPTLAPVAAEVLFPSAIPAQLTCNFGYMNTNVPCVSVNVDPLPSFESFGASCYNNGYLY